MAGSDWFEYQGKKYKKIKKFELMGKDIEWIPIPKEWLNTGKRKVYYINCELNPDDFWDKLNELFKKARRKSGLVSLIEQNLRILRNRS